ncbi:MAG: murein hydrolase activator EnvC family protein [Flavobacterium sp.]
MRLLFCLLILTTFTSNLYAQNEEQRKLEARKEQLLKEISLNEKLLSEQKRKEKSVVNIIVQQNAKINLREKLIQTNERQAKLLSDDIYKNQLQINKLKRELEVLKEDYAKMIVKSYKSRSEQSRMMFILSSNSFLQAYKRTQYMKQYAGYRKNQGEEIMEKNIELEEKNKSLAVQKQEKEKLIAEQEKEKISLEQEKKEQEKLVNSIKKDQKKINAEIKKKQEETREIDRKIQRLIREAIAAANKKTEKATGSKTPTTATSANKIVLTPEGKIVSDNFKANKGKLPWPVEKGFVSMAFGNQPHPIQRSIIINSNGVEISTEPGAIARAVFDGEVMSVNVLSPINTAVMVQHGDFITVYQNLGKVSVSKGQKVSMKQVIGTVNTNQSTGRTAIKFNVLQNDTYHNPQAWLMNM